MLPFRGTGSKGLQAACHLWELALLQPSTLCPISWRLVLCDRLSGLPSLLGGTHTVPLQGTKDTLQTLAREWGAMGGCGQPHSR